MDFASKWDNIGKPLHMLQEAKCTSVLIVLGPISPEQKRTQMRKRICSDGFFLCSVKCKYLILSNGTKTKGN